MEKYIEILLNSYSGYFNYLKTKFYTWTGITIYGLIAISLVVWLLEIIFPWRKEQAILRKDFGSIYFIFFQFFLLNLILLIALSNVMEQFINDTLHIFGFELMSIQLFQYQNYHKPSLYFHSSS
jgi:succinate dehydrogenase hydrophobic anchor subunit